MKNMKGESTETQTQTHTSKGAKIESMAPMTTGGKEKENVKSSNNIN